MPTYEKVDFCKHCQERQTQREITHQQKLKVIQEPANEVPARGKNRRKFWKRIDGTKLNVILKEVNDGKKALFITSYWSD